MSQPTGKQRVTEAIAKVKGFDDPAIERHKAELFGTPAERDDTPVDQRNPGPGRVLVEWIGENGPLAEQKLAMAVQLGLIPAAVVTAWKQIHAVATTRITGLAHHTMTRERDGMSETVTWGPYNYVQAVTHKDAETLLSGTFGHQFRIIGYTGWQPADMSPIDRFLAPFVPAETTEQVRHIVVEEHAPQQLAGIEVVVDGRGNVQPTGRGGWIPSR